MNSLGEAYGLLDSLEKAIETRKVTQVYRAMLNVVTSKGLQKMLSERGDSLVLSLTYIDNCYREESFSGEGFQKMEKKGNDMRITPFAGLALENIIKGYVTVQTGKVEKLRTELFRVLAN